MSGIWVVVEERDGRVSRISWEAVAAGQRLAALTGLAVNAALIGAQTEALAAEVAARALGRVARVEHPLLAAYTPDGFSLALQQFFDAEKPELCGFSAHLPGARLRSGAGCAAGPDAHRRRDRHRRRPRLHAATDAGPAQRLLQAHRRRAVLCLGAGWSLPRRRASRLARRRSRVFSPTIEAAQIRTRPGERFRGSAQTVDLGSAQRIVSVGRGIKDADNIPLVQELATALGAELGASRPICDNGWLPMERQIGSSGQTVSPKLYLAVGISGAIQHLVGMKGSQCVVAINKDPGAPIFEAADYGIVGDLFEVVPALTEAVKAAKQ